MPGRTIEIITIHNFPAFINRSRNHNIPHTVLGLLKPILSGCPRNMEQSLENVTWSQIEN
jgi:hypothetical protein